jgi:hypothetical protein
MGVDWRKKKVIKVRIHDYDPTSYNALAFVFGEIGEASTIINASLGQGYKVMIESAEEKKDD